MMKMKAKITGFDSVQESWGCGPSENIQRYLCICSHILLGKEPVALIISKLKSQTVENGHCQFRDERKDVKDNRFIECQSLYQAVMM